MDSFSIKTTENMFVLYTEYIDCIVCLIMLSQFYNCKYLYKKKIVMRNIFCEFEISTYNTLCSRRPCFKSNKRPWWPSCFFKMRPKIFPGKIFMVTNISCKFEKASYNIFLLER